MPTATAVKVVDASALAALIFGEPEGAAMAERLRGRLVAPGLLDYELANICLTKIKRDPGQRLAYLRGLGLRREMRIDIVTVSHEDVVRLAESAGLSAYDASYLWLAQHLKGDLVTLDRKLAAALMGREQTARH